MVMAMAIVTVNILSYAGYEEYYLRYSSIIILWSIVDEEAMAIIAIISASVVG